MALSKNQSVMPREAVQQRLKFLGWWYAFNGDEKAMNSLGDGIEEVWIRPEILTREEVAEMLLPHLADGLGWPERKDSYGILRYFVTKYFLERGLSREKARSILKDHTAVKGKEAS